MIPVNVGGNSQVGYNDSIGISLPTEKYLYIYILSHIPKVLMCCTGTSMKVVSQVILIPGITPSNGDP